MDDKMKGDGLANVSDKQVPLNRVVSVQEGHIDADVEKHGNLHRTLTPRMIHVCPPSTGYT